MAYVYPLTVGLGGAYLVDQNGAPYLLIGDTASSLTVQGTLADADTYFADRAARGFTGVWLNVLEARYGSNAPSNIYGEAPFSGAAFSAAPNAAYFTRLDAFVQAAAARNMCVFFFVAFLGFNCGNQGFCQEIQAASAGDMATYGTYLGTRYKDVPNIVWVIGGDANPSPVYSKLNAMVAAIQAADTNHIFTAHAVRGTPATGFWGGEAWLTLNSIYTNGLEYSYALSALGSGLPFFMIEGYFEHVNIEAQEARAQIYWTLLSGGFGGLFGNCPLWSFGAPQATDFCAVTPWQAQLASGGSVGYAQAGAFFRGYDWWTFTPDSSHTILTAGYGTNGQANYVAAASDGDVLIAYLPSARTVTVNTMLLGGTTIAGRWFNPASGATTTFGPFAKDSAALYTPPSSGDWVLVLGPSDAEIPTPPPVDGSGSGGGVGSGGGGTSENGGNTGGIDPTISCCLTGHIEQPSGSTTGPILPPVNNWGGPACAGGGDVPTAPDLTDSEAYY